MSLEPPVHPSAPEVAEDGIELVRDAATDSKGVVVHGVSREPITCGEKKDEREKENAA
jgi:hypothetical protein